MEARLIPSSADAAGAPLEAGSPVPSSESSAGDVLEAVLSSNLGNVGELGVELEDVVKRERLAFDILRRARQGAAVEGRSRRPIGLAISGGGTRAAAFHAGVFWCLAAQDKLKDVEHLCGVSGGGYTAASYISHLCHSDEPAGDVALDAWYRDVAARFLLRMQRNINYMVELPSNRLFKLPSPNVPEDAGSSCFPRILDLPLFLGALVGSMVGSPILLALHTLWPFVFFIELLHGAMLREAWCDPILQVLDSGRLQGWFQSSVIVIMWAVVANIVLGMLKECCGPSPQRYRCYLGLRSIVHVISRGVVCYSFYVLAVVVILLLQTFDWQSAAEPSTAGAWARSLCHHYITENATSERCSDWMVDSLSPAGHPWYEAGNTHNYFDPEWVRANASVPPGAPPWNSGVPFGSEPFWFHFDFNFGLTSTMVLGIMGLLCYQFLLQVIGTIIVPVGYFCLIVQTARWRIFGPITSQTLGVVGKYSSSLSFDTFYYCSVAVLVTMPCYDVIHKFAHVYYRRALRQAFFMKGRDVTIKDIMRSPYCPNLLFGACVHDFRKPWETKNHVDFTISSLFVGCKRTGYYRNPDSQSLATLMTIAGAAPDATFLLGADVLGTRLFLAVISLRFGDFLRLLPEGGMARVLDRQVTRMMRFLRGEAWRWNEENWIAKWCQGLMDRLPACLPFFIAQFCLLWGESIGGRHRRAEPACTSYHLWLYASLAIFALTFVSTFLTWIWPLQWLMRSPMIQQLQLVAMHRYKAPLPPPYLYISDGGLLEPLGICPLLRRRLPCIVISDAAEDVSLTMRCLRDAIVICRKEKLCTFYDPRDIHRDLDFVLQDFRDSGTTGFLHLKVHYEYGADSRRPGEDADLFYLRMRLLPGDRARVRGLLTKEELLQMPPLKGAAPPAEPDLGPRRDMTGVCCRIFDSVPPCRGRLFPNFGVGNQFLTPLHFANLAGLAAELCRPLVEKLSETDSPQADSQQARDSDEFFSPARQ